MLNLPKEVQEAINASSWERLSEEIGKKYLLNEDEINTLQLETASFLLGFIDEDSFPTYIEDEVGLSRNEANKISEEIFQKIFIPIDNALPESFKLSTEEPKEPELEPTLDNRLSKFPPEMSKIIEESNYQSTLFAIAKSYNFSVPQMGALEKIVTNLIVGAVRPNDFQDLLEDSLDLERVEAQELMTKINEQISVPIREKMKGLGGVHHATENHVDAQEHARIAEGLSAHGIEIVSDRPANISTPPVAKMPAMEVVEKARPVPIVKIPEKVVEAPPVPDLPLMPSAPLPQVGKLELEPAPPANLPVAEKKETDSILTQKLSTSFRIPVVKTDHSENSPKKSGIQAVEKTKVDPYREIPE